MDLMEYLSISTWIYMWQIADNNRIQLFQSGQLNATTVAGNTSSTITISLNCPTGIVLDADKHLFIVDNSNHRIVGSGPNGFRCLVGCNGTGGSASDQLSYPMSLSFDSYGNIFVTDTGNNRIQKFVWQQIQVVSLEIYSTHNLSLAFF